MKSTMDRVPAWLALMAAAILTFTFTACSDDEDIENEVTYTYVFTEISASHPDFLEEKGKIENAFKSALGATGSNFTKRGTVEECDKQVYAACEKACNSLKGEVWQGDYLLEVTNTLTEEVVCMAVFNADNENIFGGSSQAAKENTAKNFTNFVKKIYPDFPAVQSGGLTCTDFKNEEECFAFMYNQIDRDDIMAQKRFRGLCSISSEYLIMSYKRSDVKNGFSKLDIWFRKEKGQPRYIITFKNPNQ